MSKEDEPAIIGPRAESQGPLCEQEPFGPGVEPKELHPPPRPLDTATVPADPQPLHLDELINPFAGLPDDQREQLLDALDRAVAQRKTTEG